MAYVSMFLANPYRPDPRVRKEANALSSTGHIVRILAWDRECRYQPEEKMEGYEVSRLQIKGSYGRFLPLLPGFLAFYLRVCMISLGRRPDVVHCHDMDTLVPGVIVSKLLGAKLVYDMHESYPDFISTFAPALLVRFLRFLEPFLIRRADLVVTTSKMIGEIAGRAGARKVIPVMNCFDPFPTPAPKAARTRSELTREGEFLVLYIGGLFAGRGLEEIIEAVARVDGVKLFMGGYGPLEPTLRKLTETLGAGERVVFGGEIDPKDVPDYDAAADLLFALYKAVDPNNVLTIPNKFFESIAAAKPILVSNIGEKSDLVAREGNGVAVDPDDVDSIAEAIRKLKEEHGAYNAMVGAARRAQSRYNWGRMARALVEAYSELC